MSFILKRCKAALAMLIAGACVVSAPVETLAAPDGERFCRAAIAGWRAKARRGHGARPRPCVVFDIDNTLVDKRPTTRGAARRYGKAFSLDRLAGLTCQQMGWDGRATAKRAGLDERSSAGFQRYWNGFFWNPRRFVALDAPIAKTVTLAKAAKAAGCDVYYVTGRYDSLKDATITQLARHGLPDADAAHVRCKPSSMQTSAFKIAEMKRIQRKAGPVLWFASDARSDVAAIQRTSKVPCVLVDFPAKPPQRPAISPETPVIRIDP